MAYHVTFLATPSPRTAVGHLLLDISLFYNADTEQDYLGLVLTRTVAHALDMDKIGLPRQPFAHSSMLCCKNARYTTRLPLRAATYMAKEMTIRPRPHGVSGRELKFPLLFN